MTRTTATPHSAAGQQSRGQLSWRGHRVRDRVMFKLSELRHVIRTLAPAGQHDLALYLWMVASMQYVAGRGGVEATATVTQSYQALARAVGIELGPKSAVSTVTRVVKRLADAKLVTVERRPGRGAVIRMLNPEGTGEPYRMPDPKRGAKVFLPGAFFANGWHAVLPKAALALLLAGCIEETRQWRHHGAKGRPGTWTMSRDEIEAEYRIHHDAIDRAKRELGERGLMLFEFDELNDAEREFQHMPPHTLTIFKKVWELTPAEAPRYELRYERDGALDRRTMTWLRLKQPKFRSASRRGSKVVPLHPEGTA